MDTLLPAPDGDANSSAAAAAPINISTTAAANTNTGETDPGTVEPNTTLSPLHTHTPPHV